MPTPDISVGDEVTAELLMAIFSGAFTSTPQGMIARAVRTTATGNIVGTETGVLRIDNIPLYAGRAYRVSTSPINMDADVATDAASLNAECRFRYSTSGTATTSSSLTNFARQSQDNAAYSNNMVNVTYFYPGVNATLSILLTAVRRSASNNLVIFASSSEPLYMTVEDLGLAPADTGVVI